MISFLHKQILLIIGIIGICHTAGWNLGDEHHGLTFGEISLDHIPIKQDIPSWDHIQSEEKKPYNGLQAWLTDVVVGKYDGTQVNPVIKNIGYPIYKEVEVKVPYPEVQQEPKPYPILVPVLHPVPFEVTKTVVKTVEKKVPTPVEKIVPVPVEKLVPFEVIKHVPVLVEKKIPIKIPVYKTIHHKID